MSDYESLPLTDDFGEESEYPFNITYQDLEDAADTRNRFIQVYTLLALAVLGLTGNIFVIVLIRRKYDRKRCYSNIDYLIIQLTIADLLVAIFCVLADAIWKITFQWLAGDLMCKVIKFMQMQSLYASTFIIVTISLDRCIAILNPLPNVDKYKIVRVLTVISWTGSVVCSIPQLVIFGARQAPMATPFFQCVTHGFYQQEWHETVYVLCTFTVMGAVPLLTITASYSAIFLKLNLKLHQRSRTLSQNRRNLNHLDPKTGLLISENKREVLLRRAMTKSLWISVLVIITFIICWGPYYVAMLYYLIVRDANNKQVHHMSQIIFFFGMSNSVLNPVIYGAFPIICHLFRKSQTAWKRRNHASSCQTVTLHYSLRRLDTV